MEKEQVTFTVQASGMTGELGQVILIASLVLDRSPQELVVLGKTNSGVQEIWRTDVSPGALGQYEANLIATQLGDVFYTRLCVWKGVQTDLGVVQET